MMAALKGTLHIFTKNIRIEHCNTQFAAPIRPSGMFILVFRNQIPATSAIKRMTRARPSWMAMAVENTAPRRSSEDFPNSKVRNRLMAPAMAPVRMENMATTPPTAP